MRSANEETCKHRFKPRYSEKTPAWVNELLPRMTHAQTLPMPKMEQIYECDICIRCGKVVKP